MCFSTNSWNLYSQPNNSHSNTGCVKSPEEVFSVKWSYEKQNSKTFDTCSLHFFHIWNMISLEIKYLSALCLQNDIFLILMPHPFIWTISNSSCTKYFLSKPKNLRMIKSSGTWSQDCMRMILLGLDSRIFFKPPNWQLVTLQPFDLQRTTIYLWKCLNLVVE